ncbi:MAG TPA: DUF932 domain-containing protein [bacterium]|nr:DUF932 domain-containing protein [bacterium]
MNENYDFPVLKKKIYTEDDEVIQDRIALFNGSTNKFMSIVGHKYRVVEHKNVAEKAADAISKITPKFTVGNYVGFDGARFYQKYILRDDRFTITVRNTDYSNLVIRVCNSYDGSVNESFTVEAYRLVCKNGMVAPSRFQSIRKRHTGSNDFNSLDIEDMRKSINNFERLKDIWAKLANENMSTEDFGNFFEHNFGKRDISKEFVNNSIASFNLGRDNTRWGGLNALTYNITHNTRVKNEDNLEFKKVRLGEHIVGRYYRYYNIRDLN